MRIITQLKGLNCAFQYSYFRQVVPITNPKVKVTPNYSAYTHIYNIYSKNFHVYDNKEGKRISHVLLLYYIQQKIFFRRSFSYYSPCPNLEGIKDALFYKLEGPRLVRFTVLCAQTRLAIETHSWTNGLKHHALREACSTGHRASSKARDEVYSLS